jgi:hypothetical protein
MAESATREPWAFAPKSFASPRTEFGRKRDAFTASSVSGGDVARLRAAQLQHSVVFALRQALAGTSLKAYIASEPPTAGLSYVRLNRMMRGEVQMQIADLMELAVRFREVREVMANPRWFGNRPQAD